MNSCAKQVLTTTYNKYYSNTTHIVPVLVIPVVHGNAELLTLLHVHLLLLFIQAHSIRPSVFYPEGARPLVGGGEEAGGEDEERTTAATNFEIQSV